MLNDDVDIVSTVRTRRFPSGMNFEIIRTSTFLQTYPCFSKKSHFEHSTTYFYENSNRFNIAQVGNNVENPENYKLSFDTKLDRRRIERFLKHIKKPHYFYTLKQKCLIYNRLFGEKENA